MEGLAAEEGCEATLEGLARVIASDMPALDASAPSLPPGRLGPPLARLHRPYGAGDVEEGPLGRCDARSAFASARANVAVFAGRHQYEVGRWPGEAVEY